MKTSRRRKVSWSVPFLADRPVVSGLIRSVFPNLYLQIFLFSHTIKLASREKLVHFCPLFLHSSILIPTPHTHQVRGELGHRSIPTNAKNEAPTCRFRLCHRPPLSSPQIPTLPPPTPPFSRHSLFAEPIPGTD